MADAGGPGRSQGGLVAAALEGASWEDLLTRLEAVIGRTCGLVAVHGGLLASSAGPGPAVSRPASGMPASDSTVGGLTASDVASLHDDARSSASASDVHALVETTDGTTVRAFPVAAGRRRVGALFVHEPPTDAEAIDTDVLDDAVLALAIVAARRDAEAAVVADEASGLIAELRYGSGRDADALRRSAERFGLRLDLPHAACVFAHGGANQSAWTAAVHWIESPIQVTGDAAWTILTGDPAAELRRIQGRLQGIVGGRDTVVAAAGSTVDDVGALGRSFREAEAMLAVARARGVDTLTPEASGIDSVLLGVDPRRLGAFVTATLAPILDDSTLVDTLEAWIDARGSRVAVADALFVHRNTVGYRMQRVAALLDVDPDDPEVVLRLRTALAAHRLLQVAGEALEKRHSC